MPVALFIPPAPALATAVAAAAASLAPTALAALGTLRLHFY